jgi:hypothetical protein
LQANIRSFAIYCKQIFRSFPQGYYSLQLRQWRDTNPKAEGNIRDAASLEQLVVLSNMESINAVLIHQGLQQSG